MGAKLRSFHLSRVFRNGWSEQWVLLPCRHSWGLHVGSPFGLFDVHFLPDGGVRGTLLFSDHVYKRGKRSFPSTEQQHWLSLLRYNFSKDDSARCEIRMVEVGNGVLCWTAIEDERVQTFIDPVWSSTETQPFRSDPEFEFHLVSRAATSEVYSIWPCEPSPIDHLNRQSSVRAVRRAIDHSRRRRIGQLHLHFEESGGLVSILLENVISSGATEALIDSIGFHLLRGSGRVFSLTVYHGTEKNTMYEWTNATHD